MRAPPKGRVCRGTRWAEKQAQYIRWAERGTTPNKYVALFVGIAPIDDPRIVTIVVIDEPKGSLNHGGTAAAPAFSEMTRDTLRILNVPPFHCYH